MERPNLVNGKKEELISIFKELRKIKGTSWPRLLRSYDAWYDTAAGSNAWSNAIRSDRSVGNETLRRIIADMQAIVTNQRAKTTLQRQGLTRRAKV